ncbi:acyl carrier protein [Paenibacillus sp. sgz5001063]|uniref:acyl carrier protein n=1 Tax=Paenibacillus sp. sgz5001063 TaxID=3242474 RepID=UPI0036D310F0
MNEVKASIRQFLSRYIKNVTLEDHDDIFASGFVNSLFAMQLVMFLESQFKIRIQNNDMNFDNFRTIDAIAELVDRLVPVQ